MKQIENDPLLINLYGQIHYWKQRANSLERERDLLLGQVSRRLTRIEKRIKKLKQRKGIRNLK